MHTYYMIEEIIDYDTQPPRPQVRPRTSHEA